MIEANDDRAHSAEGFSLAAFLIVRLRQKADELGGDKGAAVLGAIDDAMRMSRLINEQGVPIEEKIEALNASIDNPATREILIESLRESEEGLEPSEE